MATFKSDISDLSDMISKLKINDVGIDAILQAGGEPCEDAIRKAIESIPVRDNTHYSEDNKGNGLLKIHKIELGRNLGVAKMQKRNGIYDVKVGFYNGYSKTKSKKYPDGIPIQLLVRGLEKGTSWLNKYPFISRAFKRSQKNIVNAMQKELENQVK